MFSGTLQGTDRSAHACALKKSLHKRKILTHYFHAQWGCAGTDRSAHVPLHIISMFSGTVQGTDGNAHVPLKNLIQKKKPYIIVNILRGGSMRFIAIYMYAYKSLHNRNFLTHT